MRADQDRRRRRPIQPGTAIALLALFVSLGGTALAATERSDGGGADKPSATVAKALGTKHLKIRRATVAIQGGTFNANYNSATAAVSCKRGEVALSVGTQWEGGENRELTTQFARLTVNSKGKPTGGVARGGSDEQGAINFTVLVLCAS